MLSVADVELALVFAEGAAVAPKFAAEIADALVDKCLNAARTSTKACPAPHHITPHLPRGSCGAGDG